MTRVLIADDHPVVREGIRRVLERSPDIQVVGEVSEGTMVPDAIAQNPVDVLVLDISMPGPTFLQTLETLREQAPRVRVLILSAHPEEQFALRALRSGASGYLEKSYTASQLLEAVHRVAAGRRYISEKLAEQLATGAQGGQEDRTHEALSEREFQVLLQIAAGRSLKQIAAALEINPKTVSSYRARILAKLGFTTNAELVRYAMQHQLLDELPPNVD